MDKTFQNLIVWQKAHEFVLEVYRHSSKFPHNETYGLTSQIRRAAVSIAANITEGYRKRSIADKLRYYNIAQGSADECCYYLILTTDLGYGESPEANDKLLEVIKMLESYSNSIRANYKIENK